jgi:hypothetical protein
MEEARTAVAEIDAQLRSLEQRGAELPPEIVQHSRFQDVVRAMDTASAAMRSVLEATGKRGALRDH